MTWHWNRDERTWTAKPDPQVEYKIVRRWLKGMVLYCNGAQVASDVWIHVLKQEADKHWSRWEHHG